MLPLITQPGPLPLQTVTDKGGNLYARLTYADLKAGNIGAGSAESVLLFTTVPITQGLELDHVELITPFADSADAANNSTAITIGDAGSAARYLASTELNLNGAYVPLAYGSGTKYVPPSSVNAAIVAVVTPPGGKQFNTLTQGELHMYFKLRDAANSMGVN